MSKIAKMQVTAQEGTDWQPTEEQEQAYVFQWAMLMEKQYPELRLLYHCPNGELRDKIIALKLKRLGVKKGVPDLFLPVARCGFNGLYIEMKRKHGGRLSPEQKQWLADLEAEHYRAIVCHGGEEACDEIYRYLTETEQ